MDASQIPPAQSSMRTTLGDTVMLNWILFKPYHNTQPLVIRIPRHLYDEPSQSCRSLFVQPLLNRCKVATMAEDIKFWTTREPLLARDAVEEGWAAFIESFKAHFMPIPLTTPFSDEIVVEDGKLIHLVITVESKGSMIEHTTSLGQRRLHSVRSSGVEEDGEEGDYRLRKRMRTTLDIGHRAIPSVSSMPIRYRDFQNGKAPILDGRHGGLRNDIGLPVEVYHPAFAHFIGVMGDSELEPPKDILDLTIKLMDAASEIATIEANRQADTRDLLGKLLNIQTVNMNKSSADHAVIYGCDCPNLLGSAALVIVEEQGELGTSGEGSVQGSFSFLQHWSDPGRKNLASATCCPSFIISIAGPWLVVLGAVFTSSVIIHRLTDYIWLGHSRLIDDKNTVRIARIFTALRSAVAKLRSFYQALTLPIQPRDRFFPCATSYVTNESGAPKVMRFQYVKHLREPDVSCTAFLARDANGQPLVVKFVERYGTEAHEFMAKSRLAPKLLYCGNIWQEGYEKDGCRSLKMVVMEYIDGVTGDNGVSDTVRNAVLDAITRLHSAGFVHGDVRGPNIIVARGNVDERIRTKILDFDWAGREGEVRYPLRLSPGLWAPGISDNEVITRNHDLAMVKKL